MAQGTVSVGSSQTTRDGTLANYYITQAISGPCVGEVATGGPVLSFSGAFTVPNDVLMMAPGDPSLGTPEDTVVRFTAPEKGAFDITGSFINLEGATVSVFVVVNGITEFTGGFSGPQGTIPFSISDLHLEAGATVDFIVDSLGSRSSDVLGLTAQITEIPAPLMLDAVAGKTFTTLSATAEGGSIVSIFDGTKLVENVIAAANGTWSLPIPNLGGKGIHSFTETSTLGADTASSAGVTLFSQASNQSLKGGSGNDVLIGAPGDTLAGGGGSNTFVFNASFGKETIKDFNVSQDVLAFAQSLFPNGVAQVLSQAHDSKAGAVIVVDNHDTVTLTGVTVAQLQSGDFHFF